MSEYFVGFSALPVPVSSGLSQGNPFTVTGSGFGTKSTGPGPLVRDVGNAAAGTLDSQWTGGYPDGPALDPQIIQNYNFPYTPPSGSTIDRPHPFVPRILSGIHGQTTGAIDLGETVGPFKGFSQPTNPYSLYTSFYYREDPAFVYDQGSPKDNNNKHANWSPALTPFHTIGLVGDIQQAVSVTLYVDPGTGQNSAAYNNTLNNQWVLQNGASQGPIETPDRNGHGTFWGSTPNPANPSGGLTQANNWHKHEHLILWDFNNGPTGYAYWKKWVNGQLQINYQGATDYNVGLAATRCFMLASYARSRGSYNNARFYADMYLDVSGTLAANNSSSCAVCWLGDNSVWANCVIREPQVVTSWSNTSITFICWRGALASGNVWVHVLNESGTFFSIGPFTL